MSIKVEKIEKNKVKLEITVDAKVFEEGMEKSYKKNVSKFNIPGFRKGKAPRKIIENLYGEGALYEDAVNIVCSESYDKAIIDNNIEAVGAPEVDIIQIGSGQDLIYTAIVAVKPEVVLGEYKKLEVENQKVEVKSEDVDAELQKYREKNARIINIENRPVESHDIATIDFEGFIDEVPFEGGKGENYELEIGSSQFIPGFEEQLIGANIDQTIDVKVKFPEEYHNDDVKGKDALFKVKINGIKNKELPELDDDFAKDVSEFDTLDELKKDIEEKLTEQLKNKAKFDMENELIKLAAQNAEIDIPEVMIEKQVQDMEKDFDMRLRYQGLTLAKYLQFSGSDVEAFRTSIKPQAIEQLKGRLTLEAIAKAEGIDASEEEYQEELSKLASQYKQSTEDFMKHLHTDDIKYIKEGIIINKTVDFLLENSKSKTSGKKESKKKSSGQKEE